MVQAWPLAWLMRIGSIKKLPMWTFLQTLTCWFFTRGKATTSLQYERGMRHYSHHSKINPSGSGIDIVDAPLSKGVARALGAHGDPLGAC